jgi:hypothetical protein
MTCMLTENETIALRCMCICWCVGCGRKSIFFKRVTEEKNRERERGVKSPLFSSLCTSLVVAVVVPSTPSQGSDESNKNFGYYVTVTSFSLLSSLRDMRHACILKKCIIILIYLINTNIQSVLSWQYLIDKIKNDYYKIYARYSLLNIR